MKPQVSDFFIANSKGVCITSEGLDAIWPRDNTTAPLTLDGKVPFNLPPTCIPGAVPFEIEIGRDKLINFVFNGNNGKPHNDMGVPAVPLPDTIGFMIGIVVVWVLVMLFKHCDDLEEIR